MQQRSFRPPSRQRPAPARTVRGELLRLWRLWVGLGLLAIAIGLTLTFVSCQSPRKPSYARKPGKAHDQPQRSAIGETTPQRFLEPPPASSKDDSQQILDPDRPCFTRGQARRARAVLFRNRSRETPAEWISALNDAFYELKADCASDEFLLLAVTTIQMESNVRVDPPVANANLEELYANRLKQFRKEHILEAAALGASGLDDQLRTKLRQDTRKGKVNTEADLDRYVGTDLRPWLLKTLQTDYHLPQGLADLVVTRAVPDPVHTIGPMQVDFDKAYRNALKRGENVPNVAAMKEWLLNPETALRRGLKEGVYLLQISYAHYRAQMEPDQAILFTAADYNGGEFSSRNAAFQERVAVLTGKKLVLDGDLLLYRNGTAEAVHSKTESGVLDILQSEMTADQVRRDLLTEKDPAFTDSRTNKAICTKFESRRRMPCVPARLPVGAVNPTAENKWGKTLTPADYAYGYVKRFRANRDVFAVASETEDPLPYAADVDAKP